MSGVNKKRDKSMKMSVQIANTFKQLQAKKVVKAYLLRRVLCCLLLVFNSNRI